MNLSEISAALQRGESLTGPQKFFVVDALLGRVHVVGTDADWWFVASQEGDPFTSVAPALAFVAKAFPLSDGHTKSLEEILDGTWEAKVFIRFNVGTCNVFYGHAPTPSAAIMAAAIEAHLAKGEG